MPIPLLAMGAISGGVSALGGLASGLIQNRQIDRTNAQNRQFAMDMYNMQRRDTLADWARTNEYNDPAQQMARFKAAGLSPHLIYGQMNNAPAIKTPDAPKFEAMPHQRLPIGESVEAGLNNYFSTRLRSAELNLAEQNIKNAIAQQKYIETNTIKTANEAGLKDVEMNLKKEMFPHIVQTAVEKERLTNAQVAKTLGDNERNWKILSYDIQRALASIAKTNSEISIVPYQKRVLAANADRIRNDISWNNVSQKQKAAIGNLLQEQTAIKNLLLGKEIDWKEVQTEMKQLEIRLAEMGLSKTFISDFIGGIPKLAPPVKTIQLKDKAGRLLQTQKR